MPEISSRLLKNGFLTLRQAQGERKSAMKSGRGSAHAEPVEALGGVFQQPARFFGIIIRMYVEVGGPHHRSHFHAYFQDDVGIYDIESCDRLAGSLPRREERLVIAWAELHRDELLANWNALQGGTQPAKVEPLR